MLSEAKHPRSFTEKTTAETLRCAQGDRPSAVSLSSVTQLLLAAPGREPPDSATVSEHGPADRLAAPTRRVGEPQTGADFGGERDRGGESVRGTGRKRVSFEFWDSAERQDWPVLGPEGAQSTECPRTLQLEADEYTFPVERKLKTEILAHTCSAPDGAMGC